MVEVASDDGYVCSTACRAVSAYSGWSRPRTSARWPMPGGIHTEVMFLGLMRPRGMECRATHAEAFCVSKTVLAL